MARILYLSSKFHSFKSFLIGNGKDVDDYVPKRLKQLFLKQTNIIKQQREKQQQAWNIDVRTCKLSERAGLNQENFKIFFNHASQYRQIHNAYYVLLNDYRQVRPNSFSTN